ncbi:hypothetical protein NBO_33g0024 [Nosema bombycis CQ1]|uniref:Uncharacterized protein n=1 Tax=Nosema bombycis (strain CQ1 / CVCC 102059) TaxID=578461 RepID=R0MMW6_NOSB1|nr:hypothetical protein NBO_33g0024 [Nosema bombycis CQ1]|eukprot:EOB14218.1 hypothetical protein NBO_33g0024 [Nosema bombycis CQ1]
MYNTSRNIKRIKNLLLVTFLLLPQKIYLDSNGNNVDVSTRQNFYNNKQRHASNTDCFHLQRQ